MKRKRGICYDNAQHMTIYERKDYIVLLNGIIELCIFNKDDLGVLSLYI